MYAGHVVERAGVEELFADPRHPYAEALLDSVPQAGRARSLLNVIPGRVPPAGAFPTGCRFQPRCAYAIEDLCSAPQAELEPVPGHLCRCVRTGTRELSLERQP
jgi:oligopeptide/dipeptide ABC transporter ATP-binding protein